MNSLMRVPYMLVLVGWANAAYAVVPPETAMESPPAGMSFADWLFYGSLAIVLGGLFVAVVMLLMRLAKMLFRH